MVDIKFRHFETNFKSKPWERRIPNTTLLKINGDVSPNSKTHRSLTRIASIKVSLPRILVVVRCGKAGITVWWRKWCCGTTMLSVIRIHVPFTVRIWRRTFWWKFVLWRLRDVGTSKRTVKRLSNIMPSLVPLKSWNYPVLTYFQCFTHPHISQLH